MFGPLWPTQFVTDVKSNLIVATAVFPLATDVGTIGPMIDMSQENLAHSLKKLLADAGYTSILDLIDCKARGIDLYAPVQENGLTEQNKAKKPVKVIQIPRSEFQFSPNTNRYTCPAGHEMPGTRNGKVRRFDGRELASTSYQLPVKICQACPLKESCLRSGKMNRRINRVEGQEVLDAQREKMTEEIAKATRTTRAQTAERSFAEVKTRACLNRIGCKTIERANTIVALHVVAINLLRLYRLRQARKTVEISG